MLFEGKHVVSERLHCLKHGCLEHPTCLSWMVSVLPSDFSSLLSILFCNAVPGVVGTVCGVFNDRDSKCKGWDVEVKKINCQQHLKVCLRARKSITIITQQVKIIFTSIQIRCLLLLDIPTSMLNFNLLFFCKIGTGIARRLISDTGVISIARFPTRGARVVCIEWVAEVTAFG